MSGAAIAAEALPLLTGVAALALLVFLLASWLGRWRLWLLGYTLAVLALALAFFFRDPERALAGGPDLFLSPADGHVVAVDHLPEPDYLHGDALRVAIETGMLDVHVQRSPADGVVDYVERSASMAIGINTGEVRVLVRQPATGASTRGNVTYVEEGERVDQGERLGRIRASSRVETFLPAGVQPLVGPGDRVRAGATAIARHVPRRLP